MTKVIIEVLNPTTKFSALSVGDWFLYNGMVHVRIPRVSTIASAGCDALRISDTRILRFDDDSVVEVLSNITIQGA